MLQLANKDMGALFRIGVDDWAAINRRVRDVLRAEYISWIVTRSLPAYPVLLQHCKTWPTMFRGIRELSIAIAAYADGAVRDFSALLAEVKQIRAAGGQLPDTLVASARAKMQTLKERTALLAVGFDQISYELGAFLDANREVDKQIAGGGVVTWALVNHQAAQMESALEKATGQWRAVTDDLHTAVSLPVDAMLPLLEIAELETAVDVWRNLRDECNAFPASMAEQLDYWERPKSFFETSKQSP